MTFLSGFQIMKMWIKLAIWPVIFTMFWQISAVHVGPIHIDPFNGNYTYLWTKADWGNNGDVFDCIFRKRNALIPKALERLILTVSDCDPNLPFDPDWPPCDRPYDCAEVRSQAEDYHYGRYAVRMKAIRGEGIISSFFIYTDEPQHDEIDVEILGKDCETVQFGYFTDGESTDALYEYQLPFDACDGFHNYAFEWQETYIKFFVDGQLVHTATGPVNPQNPSPNDPPPLPTHPGRIMMNVWVANAANSGLEQWAGTFDPANTPLPVSAEYEWVIFTY